MPEPIYTSENCQFVHSLTWVATVFWREPVSDAFVHSQKLSELKTSLLPDGIKMDSHRLNDAQTSQFSLTTSPKASPRFIIQRLKGRLQYMVKAERPKALRRHFAIRSIGRVSNAVTRRYVARQLDHHQMADPQVQERLTLLQISNPDVSLQEADKTSHGRFWYHLHMVLVHQQRWMEIREEVLVSVREMVLRCARGKECQLAEAGILPDHIHLLMRCPFDQTPETLALGFLNNLAFAQGMRAAYQFGGYMGTVGEYTLRALGDGAGGTSAPPG